MDIEAEAGAADAHDVPGGFDETRYKPRPRPMAMRPNSKPKTSNYSYQPRIYHNQNQLYRRKRYQARTVTPPAIDIDIIQPHSHIAKIIRTELLHQEKRQRDQRKAIRISFDYGRLGKFYVDNYGIPQNPEIFHYVPDDFIPIQARRKLQQRLISMKYHTNIDHNDIYKFYHSLYGDQRDLYPAHIDHSKYEHLIKPREKRKRTVRHPFTGKESTIEEPAYPTHTQHRYNIIYDPPSGLKPLPQFIREFQRKYNCVINTCDKNLGIVIIRNDIWQDIYFRSVNRYFEKVSKPDPYWMLSTIQEIVLHDDYQWLISNDAYMAFKEWTPDKLANAKYVPIWKQHKKPKPGQEDLMVRPVISHNPLHAPQPALSIITAQALRKITAIFTLRYATYSADNTFQPIINADTYQFVYQIRQLKIKYPNKHFLLYSADICSYYPSMTNSMIETQLFNLLQLADQPWVTRFMSPKRWRQTIRFITHSFRIIQQTSYMSIGQTLYRQRQGVQMGTSYAPDLANLSQLLSFISFLHNMPKEARKIALYTHHIDDIFVAAVEPLRPATMSSLVHPSLSIELTTSRDKQARGWVSFMDIRIHESLLYFPLFKKLKRDYYTPYKQNIPTHIKHGIIYGQSLRLAMLSATKEIYEQARQGLITRLNNKRYPMYIIHKYLHRWNSDDQNRRLVLLAVKRELQLRALPYTTKFTHQYALSPRRIIDAIPGDQWPLKLEEHPIALTQDQATYLFERPRPNKSSIITPYLNKQVADEVRALNNTRIHPDENAGKIRYEPWQKPIMPVGYNPKTRNTGMPQQHRIDGRRIHQRRVTFREQPQVIFTVPSTIYGLIRQQADVHTRYATPYHADFGNDLAIEILRVHLDLEPIPDEPTIDELQMRADFNLPLLNLPALPRSNSNTPSLA